MNSDNPASQLEVSSDQSRQTRYQLRLLWQAVVVVSAVAMTLLVAVPVSQWHQAATGQSYRGFDRNLLAISESGVGGAHQGVVQTSPSDLRITTVTSSQPSVHLLTTSLSSFDAAMDVVVLENPAGTTPLRLGIWSPREGQGYFLVFGPAPDDSISTETVTGGSPAQTLVGGTVDRRVLGTYLPGQPYHLNVTLDKNAGRINYQIAGAAGPPTGDAMLSLAGGPNNPKYSDIFSQAVPVNGGRQFTFGALLKLVSGNGVFKINVEWLDKGGAPVGYSGDWQLGTDLNGWTTIRSAATAPSKASFARLFLGAGDDTSLLFADPYLSEASHADVNLLYNYNFKNGVEGWHLNKPTETPKLVPAGPLAISSTLSQTDAPGLFNALKLSLTASAYSPSGSSSALLQRYELLLPPATAGAVRIDDPRATLLVTVMLVIGGALLAIRTVAWIRKWVYPLSQALRDRGARGQTVIWNSRTHLLLGGLLVGTYFVGNALLFRLGNSPFDMACFKVWSYIGAEYGPAEVYVRSTVVSVAGVWGGVPYHEALFPYEPVQAYIFWFIGWVEKLFLNGPGPFTPSAFQLEFVAKAIDVVFGLGDGALIYLLMKRWKIPHNWCVGAAALFVFNPAVWFSMSIWGVNHVISLFLVLLALLLAETDHPVGAWVSLGLASLSRPQMLVFALLVGVVLMRKFPLMRNVRAASWMIILVFVLLGPFTLDTSPSFPVDFIANTLRVQEFGGNEKALTTVSLDVYSVWPLVTLFAAGQGGLNRVFYPSDNVLIGSITYQHMGVLLTLGLLTVAAGLLLVRSKAALNEGGYIPVVALGIVGFLMLLTGISSGHFILGLPFILLCKKWLRGSVYLPMVTIWTTTTFVTMYGILGFQLATADYLNLPLFASHSAVRPLTSFVSGLYSSDRFITVGVIANSMVLLVLAAIALMSHYVKRVQVPVAAAHA